MFANEENTGQVRLQQAVPLFNGQFVNQTANVDACVCKEYFHTKHQTGISPPPICAFNLFLFPHVASQPNCSRSTFPESVFSSLLYPSLS